MSLSHPAESRENQALGNPFGEIPCSRIFLWKALGKREADPSLAGSGISGRECSPSGSRAGPCQAPAALDHPDGNSSGTSRAWSLTGSKHPLGMSCMDKTCKKKWGKKEEGSKNKRHSLNLPKSPIPSDLQGKKTGFSARFNPKFWCPRGPVSL